MKKGAHILITGGTGSFGYTMVKRYFEKPSVGRITVFSRDEEKQHTMRQQFPEGSKLRFVIGDVRNRDALRHAMTEVDYVFHAAALKHVPVGEFFPMEMVETNILGTNNVLDAAEQAGVSKVVLLSTDKSVHPINAMGMTKALAEKTLIARSRNAKKTVFCIVRYGNVAASRGSVIPLFIERIKAGKTIPVTNPHMTRFLLSLEDAADLVELAIEKGKQGDIFVKKSPAATIEDLALTLADVFGSNSKIEVTGVREGEKMHEILAHSMELRRAQDLGTHFCVKPENISFKKYLESSNLGLNGASDYSSESTRRLKRDEVKKFLLSLAYVKSELAAQKHA